MKKTILKILLILIIITSAIAYFRNIIFAAPARSGNILAKDSRWSNRINVVNNGGMVFNADYSFSLKTSSQTEFNYRVQNSNGTWRTLPRTDVSSGNYYIRHDFVDGNMDIILPRTNDLNGKIGAVISNVGQYGNDMLDLLLTYTWDNRSDACPFIGSRIKNASHTIRTHFSNQSFIIKFQIVRHGTTTPVTIDKMCLSFTDVDYYQNFGLKLRGNASIAKRYVATDCEIYYNYEASGSHEGWEYI